MGVGTHPFELRTGIPESGVLCFSFETNNTSAPDGLVDYSATSTAQGEVSTTTAISREGAGDFKVTLKNVWAYIVPMGANVTEDQAYTANIHTITQGMGSTNSFYVSVRDNDGAGADTTDYTINVAVMLIRRPRS